MLAVPAIRTSFMNHTPGVVFDDGANEYTFVCASAGCASIASAIPDTATDTATNLRILTS